jgi:hypothetical protein
MPASTITPGGDASVIGHVDYNPNQGMGPVNSGTPVDWSAFGSGGSGNYPYGGPTEEWGPWWENSEFEDGETGGGYGSLPAGFGGISGQNMAGLVAGGVAAGGLLGAFGSSSSVQRNLPAEMAGILSLGPTAAAGTVATQQQLNPLLTRANTQNFNGALGDVSGSLRQAYDAANPQLSQYSAGLGSRLDQLNAVPQSMMYAHGYLGQNAQAANAGPAAQGSFAPAQAQTAQFQGAGPTAQASFTAAQAGQATAGMTGQQRAQGGPMLGQLQGDAMRSLGGVSALQAQQQQIAGGLLADGGNLSAQDVRNVQQDTRGAFAARGLFDSNQAIGAEVMNTDAARRQRLTQNLGIAQGVDAAGQQQIMQGRNYAMGVQNQGQQLSQFNAGQGNQVGMFNVGQANDTSRLNANLQTQNSQFNAGLGAQVSQYNASAQNQAAQFNAAGQNAMNQYNSGLLTQNNQYNAGQAGQMSQYNAGAQNQMGQFNAGLQQQTGLVNAGAQNTAEQYNAGVINQANLFNAQNAGQYTNDQWARSAQLASIMQQGAINPAPVAMGLMGTAPDYTSGLLGYGSDLYNTNSNAQSAANISRNNNNSALAAAGINALYNLYGKPTT